MSSWDQLIETQRLQAQSLESLANTIRNSTAITLQGLTVTGTFTAAAFSISQVLTPLLGGGTLSTSTLTIVGSTNASPTADTITFKTASTQRLLIDHSGNVVINTGAISSAATTGFLYIPTCAGTATGTPTTYTGLAPLIFDTTHNNLGVYNGAWKWTHVA